MSRAQTTVPFFRTQWAGRLIDTCTITRNTARGAYNGAEAYARAKRGLVMLTELVAWIS